MEEFTAEREFEYAYYVGNRSDIPKMDFLSAYIQPNLYSLITTEQLRISAIYSYRWT